MTAIREKAKVKPGGTVEVRNPAFPAGAEVEVIVLVPSTASAPLSGDAGCFFEILGNLKLEGPSDWSAHLDDYLYNAKSPDRQ